MSFITPSVLFAINENDKTQNDILRSSIYDRKNLCLNIGWTTRIHSMRPRKTMFRIYFV